MLTDPRGLSCGATGGVCGSSGPRHPVMLTEPSSGVCVNPCRRDLSWGSQGSGSLVPSLGMVTVLSCPLPPGAPLCGLKVTDAPLSEVGPSVMAPLPGSGPELRGAGRREDGWGQACPPLGQQTQVWGQSAATPSLSQSLSLWAEPPTPPHTQLGVGDPPLTQSHHPGTCRRPGGPRC